MERNWLIRTTQKQILGPVAKTKVLEFLEKGALGLNDEVMCGNGYWFSLKEKDLVDKYLLGDIPQGYNPISESKSVLSKREHPDKTSSLNASPLGKSVDLKIESNAPGVLPENTDLEYPDITTVNTSIAQIVKKTDQEEIKIPTNDDLEFPDIGLITETIKNSPTIQVNHIESTEIKFKSSDKFESVVDNTPVVYPESNDLDYPDMMMTGPKFTEPAPEVLIVTEPEPTLTQDKEIKKEPSRETQFNNEDKKLLHERKIKASQKSLLIDEDSVDVRKAQPRTALPEHLKKRNDNYLMYVLVILVLIILSLF